MKVFIFTFVAILAAGFLAATTFTLDNNISPVGDHTTWISAYNAASDGDTIYIYPSPIDYGPGWNEGGLGKRLTVIGGGFNPANPDLNTSRINLYVNQEGGAGSIFSGLHIYSAVTSSHQAIYVNCRFDGSVALQASGSELKNCWCGAIVSVGTGASTPTNGFLVQGCTLATNFKPLSQTDAVCSNCVFIGNTTHIETAGNNNLCCYFNNCLFANIDDGTHILQGGWSGPLDLNFVNCIMEIITINAYHTFQHCIFEGNSTYITGPGNLQDVDLELVMEDVNGGDYHLITGSPAIGAGLNGEDIGIYGGATPFNDLWYLTRLPSVTEFNCPIVVDENGDLNVHIEAQAGN